MVEGERSERRRRMPTPRRAVRTSARRADLSVCDQHDQETGGEQNSMQIQSRGPNGGNPTPTRQGRRCGAPQLPGAPEAPGPARGGLVEAIGVRPNRTKAKRREASVAGKSARGDEAPYPLVPRAYGRRDGLKVSLVLPGEICWAPR